MKELESTAFRNGSHSNPPVNRNNLQGQVIQSQVMQQHNPLTNWNMMQQAQQNRHVGPSSNSVGKNK